MMPTEELDDNAAQLDALQRALANEHAAVFFYGPAGARVAQEAEPGSVTTDLWVADLVRARLADHRRRRDELMAMVIASGGRPVASAPSYRLPAPMTNPAQVRQAAVGIEGASASHYAWLIGSSDGDIRAWALTALESAAKCQVEFGAEPVTFPGALELG